MATPHRSWRTVPLICYLPSMFLHYSRQCCSYQYIWHYLYYLQLRFALWSLTFWFFQCSLNTWKQSPGLCVSVCRRACTSSVCWLWTPLICPLSVSTFPPFTLNLLVTLFLFNLVCCTFFLTPSANLYLFIEKFIPHIFVIKQHVCSHFFYVFCFLCFLTATIFLSLLKIRLQPDFKVTYLNLYFLT